MQPEKTHFIAVCIGEIKERCGQNLTANNRLGKVTKTQIKRGIHLQDNLVSCFFLKLMPFSCENLEPENTCVTFVLIGQIQRQP